MKIIGFRVIDYKLVKSIPVSLWYDDKGLSWLLYRQLKRKLPLYFTQDNLLSLFIKIK